MEGQTNTPATPTADSVEGLQAAIGIKDARIAELEGHLTEAGVIITDQKQELVKQEQTINTLKGVKTDVPTVTVDGDVYAITAKSAKLKGVEITAQHIIEDAELAAKLVAMGAGILERIITPATDEL